MKANVKMPNGDYRIVTTVQERDGQWGFAAHLTAAEQAVIGCEFAPLPWIPLPTLAAAESYLSAQAVAS